MASPSIDAQKFVPKTLPYGHLYYEGDIPVIQYTTSDPFAVGYTHGMLAGQQIIQLYENYMKPFIQALNAAPPSCYEGAQSRSSSLWSEYAKPLLVFKLNLCSGKAQARLTERVKVLSIPEPYQEELAGVALALKDNYQTSLTVDDFLSAHVFLDSYKKLGMAGQSAAFGCSAVTLKERDITYLGRNLDWPDLKGDFHIGDYSLLSRRVRPAGGQFVSVDFPGLVGSLSGMTSTGLSLAICESGRSIAQGMPYNMVVRQLLEQTSTLGEVESYLSRQPVASSINLSAADTQEVALYQLNPQHPSPVQKIAPQGGYLCHQPFRRLANLSRR